MPLETFIAALLGIAALAIAGITRILGLGWRVACGLSLLALVPALFGMWLL